MDRFITRDPSFKAYKSLSLKTVKTRHSMPDLAHSFMRHNFDDIFQRPRQTSTAGEVLDTKNPPPYNGLIAEALGFNKQDRVLQFKEETRSQSTDTSNKSIVTSGPLLFSTPPKTVAQFLAKSSEGIPKDKKVTAIKTLIPYTVLEAAGLRNDFYSNLVSWSSSTDTIAVGIGSHVYLWNAKQGTIGFPTANFEIVTCLVFSEGDLLLIGTKPGILLLYSQKEKAAIMQAQCVNQGIYSMCWLPGSLSEFYLGDESGEVTLFKIIWKKNTPEVKKCNSIWCNGQQVCGLTISKNRKQLAVGSNRNICTIWDITDPENPVLKLTLRHHAAVKAMAFCPWSNSLLATGGGCRDRHLRFWHTNSGTLLGSLNTKGQITSLIWSRSKKQIAATFGYGDYSNPLLIAVYTYPELEQTVQVPATPNVRVLSAVTSPNFTSICTASNDETIRFYKIWPDNTKKLGAAQDGLYGSELIDLAEGSDRNRDLIR